MLRDKLASALKDATKSQKPVCLSTLRLVQAAIKDRDIAHRSCGKDPVTDEDITGILVKMVKQREESARLYDEAGRADLAAQEREEICVIKSFLPAQLSEEKVRELCASVVEETGAQGLRDMGKCIKALKDRYSGQMDFSKASGVVKEMLK
ncbi:GatB/YqeY domain-containing protein [Martelella alba]|uniref:GatB/YqeY domain-containing protein n=1 Tax=Martelella alba TaxID=2590451 RepID=A0A506UBJ7_9HYPH|nr:GatB/YqeY domain-containing protein [Martelella alba]TPW31772.1 GatB/YqeY domain-containing protein [Martelella alba]